MPLLALCSLKFIDGKERSEVKEANLGVPGVPNYPKPPVPRVHLSRFYLSSIPSVCLGTMTSLYRVARHW
jgi:hypothetical protein